MDPWLGLSCAQRTTLPALSEVEGNNVEAQPEVVGGSGPSLTLV